MVTEVLLLTPAKFEDDRGWFTESYNAKREKSLGIDDIFVQDNQSFSRHKWTIRGIHFQKPPHEQAKLVRCIRGSIIDYVIDLRRNSPTYGEHLCVELSAENQRQIYIPVGFGHAFVTLEDCTEISYKVTDFYSAELDAGIRWDSPGIAIDWPMIEQQAILSDKDRMLPLFNDFESPFEYDGIPLQLRNAG